MSGEFTVHDDEFEPIGMLRVTTASSIWFVTRDRYQRIPRKERPRPTQRSVEGRLVDGQWHELRRCWWRVHPDGARLLRLLPETGPSDGEGLISGLVLDVRGDWAPAVLDPRA